jgi:general secretion pathway protein G
MQQSQPIQPPPQTSGLAISSLVLGILSCTLLGFLAGIPAIICGHSARRKARVAPYSQSGSGLAVAGLVLGYVGTVLSAILFLVIVVPAAYNLSTSVDRSRIISVRADLQSIATQLKLYESLNDTYPTTEQGLRALVQHPTTDPLPRRWYQLYHELPKDPWGHDYIYRYPGSAGAYSYDLYTAGPDGIPDTADDIRQY